MTKRVEALIQDICGGPDHPLAPFLRRWAGASGAFLAFAGTHEGKIRKKARRATQDELNDLLAELAVAALWLDDRRFTVDYEPHQATGGRGPDFQVVYRTHTAFQVEVTRLRPQAGADLAGTALRLARVLTGKIGQCLPGAPNLLAVALPSGVMDASLTQTALGLIERAAGGPTPGLYPDSARDYVRHRQRLSAVLLCSFTFDWQAPKLELWLNPQAKHPLPSDIAKFLARTGENDREA